MTSTQIIYSDNNAAQAALDELKECSCCTTHQINKPHKLKVWTELHPTHNWDNPCQCNCRHRARWICRKMFNQEDKVMQSIAKQH